MGIIILVMGPTIGCLLCGGMLPANPVDIYHTHLQDHHRAYYNYHLLDSVGRLDRRGVEKVVEFIERLLIEEHVEENTDTSGRTLKYEEDNQDAFIKNNDNK